ncbi:FadR/GntR family transcriptional regulator [Couchioplanes caeruleus]|uniref:GntR family transcriptional regulator n=2 Tax=Couchioplanes caeruleus TaxID=56438 RepID=A0A1K0FIS6_9ACTN|nr:FCD domain-containing protein [Couchioplanes caeruleus]OJF12741.1 GntR family transcriptional regulator [Couchioplanes caeruleus subsp. caeruleus]ROP30632.1 GntR family transcriptional regulator [Couchioplanes caeruleus]
MNLGPVPRAESLSGRVIAELRHQITSGAWPVGHRIPTELELVTQLGVARNTVREAVRALAHNGLLDIRQGSGTYVVATSELAGVMQRRFATADPAHVRELRGTLEAAAAAFAARRRTDDDLDRLETLYARREQAWTMGERDAFVDADAAFHQAVVAASHNEVLIELYADLGQVIRESLRGHFGASLSPDEYKEHHTLLEAIRAGDAAVATAEAASYTSSCDTPH